MWLGNESDGGSNLLHLFDGRSALQLMNIREMTEPKRSRLRLLTNEPSLRLQNTPTMLHMLRSNTAGKFLDQMYWSRVWVVQELVLVRKMTLFCTLWPVYDEVLRRGYLNDRAVADELL